MKELEYWLNESDKHEVRIQRRTKRAWVVNAYEVDADKETLVASARSESLLTALASVGLEVTE